MENMYQNQPLPNILGYNNTYINLQERRPICSRILPSNYIDVSLRNGYRVCHRNGNTGIIPLQQQSALFSSWNRDKNSYHQAHRHCAKNINDHRIGPKVWTYNSVPRHRLVEIVRSETKGDVLHAVCFALQSIMFETRRGSKVKTVVTSCGVSEGSPLNLTLFNLYIKAFHHMPEGYTTTGNTKITTITTRRTVQIKDWDSTLFANDFKIQAKSERTLLRLFNSITTWEIEYGTRWSTTKYKIIKIT